MNKLVVAAVVVAVAVAGWRWQRAEPAHGGGRNLAFNRFWIERMPSSEQDAVEVLFLPRPESIGGFARESMWRGQIERFRFEVDGDKVRATFPASGQREVFSVRATRCEEADMDFCLDVSGSTHGVGRYYSRSGWSRHDFADEDAFRDYLYHQAAGAR